MSCDDYQQFLLDTQWNSATRQATLEALRHVETCQACQEALKDFDRLGETLSTFKSDAVPREGWSAFERRVLSPKRLSGSWRIFRAMAIAASLLIVGGLAFAIGRQSISKSPSGAPTAPNVQMTSDTLRFAPQQLSHAVNAFTQVSQVFDERASWMLISRDASDVGVSQEPVANDARKVLLLRLVLLRSGKVASDADLLVIPGQVANLTVPLQPDQSLHYRVGTSTDEPTRLSLWLEVKTPTGGAPLAALSTNLRMQPGEKITAGQLSTSAGDYELNIGFARAALPGARR